MRRLQAQYPIWIMILVMGCYSPLETGFIYFPTREILGVPSEAGLAYEEVSLTAADGVRISAWYVPCRDAAGTLLWFHGNAGNMGDRVEHLRIYHDRWGLNQMILDYRGYGKSGGKVSEEGTYQDGRAAVRYLVSDKGVAPEDLILFGRSLGSAVALQMALEFPCGGLMLEAPFASIREMARVHYPLLGRALPLRIRYDSLAKIGGLQVPLLILHGDRDSVVPLEQGRRLFEAAPAPKSFYEIRGAGHNDILARAGAEYHETVRGFLAQCLHGRKQEE